MKILLLGVISLFMISIVHAQQDLPIKPTTGMETFIRNVQNARLPETAIPDTIDEPPVFQFEAPINKTTTLEKLITIKQKAERQLGISLFFHELLYDSTGLCSMTIQASAGCKKYSSVTYKFDNDSDFGLFAVTYQHKHLFFIGTRASWAFQIRNAVVTR